MPPVNAMLIYRLFLLIIFQNLPHSTILAESLFDGTIREISTPSTESPTTTAYASLANKIIEGPQNQSLLIGSNIQMPCHIGSGLDTVWYRNDEQIPADGDLFRRISIDPADGTLWINQVGPDNTGQYRCVARSPRDGSILDTSRTAWLSIIEKPGMVQNVWAELVNDTAGGAQQERIRVHWTPGFDGNSPIVRWSVEMRTRTTNAGQSAGFWSDWELALEAYPQQLQHGSTTLAGCCSSFVENVRPSATAEFRVIAHNKFGAGKPSLPSQNVTMPQQPPTAAPTKVHASARSSQSVMVQWQPPVEESGASDEEADLNGYIVRYRLNGYATADWNERNVSDGHARNVLIEPLITWHEYDVQVAAFNTRGIGVFSKPVTVTTLEGIPLQSPRNVQVNVLNSTAILVTFEPPSPQMVPGVNLGYKLELWTETQQPVRVERLLPGFNRIERHIDGLKKFGRYNLTVLCFTAPGDGPRSEPIEFQTAEDVPGPVRSLEPIEIFSESAIFEWEAPSEPNGIIQKYLLSWYELDKSGGKGRKRELEISAHKHNYTIEGLRAQTKYGVEVVAFTRIGAGPLRETLFESGVPPEIPDKPTGLTITEIGATKARLHFIPGHDGHAPIRKWIVEARIGVSSSSFVPLAEFTPPHQRSATNSILLESLRPHTDYQLRLLAENVRGRSLPSDPSRPFRTQQSVPAHVPQKLWADPVSDTQITLVWTPLMAAQWNGEGPLSYVVQYRLTDPVLTDWEELQLSGGAKRYQFTLNGLRPFSRYQLRMVAQNAIGKSQPGPTLNTTTFEGVPSIAPTLHAKLNAQGGIEVHWDELESEHANGRVIVYQVHLMEHGNDAIESINNRSVSARERRHVQFPATLLRPFTKYGVTISAETIMGSGPESTRPIILETPEEVPDPPFNASFIYKSNNELRLGWSTPLHPKGQILHYGVLMWRQGEQRPAVPFTEVPANLNQFTATQLVKDSEYIVALKAQSAMGWGPERLSHVLTGTQNAPLPVPPVPRRDTSVAQSSNELHLIWESNDNDDSLSSSSSPSRSIELEWQQAGKENEWIRLHECIPAEHNRHTLRRLHSNTAYRVRIRYIGDLTVRSVWSTESEWLRTMESSPAHPPTNVQVHPVDATSIRVQWLPLAKEAWNADRIGYRIHYYIYRTGDVSLPNNTILDQPHTKDVQLSAVESSEPMEIVLKELKSFEHYFVQLTAYNVLGESIASRPPRAIFVGYVAPNQRVHGLRVEPVSSTALRVQWEPWNKQNHDALDGKELINGYHIRWTPIAVAINNSKTGHNDEEDNELILLEQQNELVINELLKWTEYRVTVSGYNRAGTGPESSVTSKTLEDTPGPVGQIRFHDVLLDSVRVSWAPPVEPNGNLTGYIIVCRTQKSDGGTVDLLGSRKEVQLRTINTDILLDQLDEHTMYFVSIHAETAAGSGPESVANISTWFNPGAPEAPEQIRIVPEQQWVRIMWTNGQEGNSPIKGFLLQSKRIGISTEQDPKSPLTHSSSPADPKRHNINGRKRLRHRSIHANEANSLHHTHIRHIIGHWHTLGLLEGDYRTTEWRVPYIKLDPPSSYYVFRLFARNQLGIGKPSAVTEQLHVPASIPEEPFYAQWWFQALVGVLLALVLFGYVLMLYLTNRRTAKTGAVEGDGLDDNSRKRKSKRKKAKKSRRESQGGDAFDTLQLSDGGIVSYELCAKRSERGIDSGADIFSRPLTKQSWIGTLGGAGGPNSPASRNVIGGMYGSIDDGGGGAGSSAGAGSQVPNMYAALATDAMPLTIPHSLPAAEDKPSSSLYSSNLLQHRYSPPYYQLRQFNVPPRLRQNHHDDDNSNPYISSNVQHQQQQQQHLGDYGGSGLYGDRPPTVEDQLYDVDGLPKHSGFRDRASSNLSNQQQNANTAPSVSLRSSTSTADYGLPIGNPDTISGLSSFI